MMNFDFCFYENFLTDFFLLVAYIFSCLLTGIIVSLLGQGLSLYDAAVTGACIHGRAGFLSGEDGGITGSLPSDVLKYVRVLVNANS